MREIITIIICVVIFLIALQSGLVKTGLDYEIVKKTNENLQAANERLTQEIKRMNNLSQTGDTVSADQVAILERLEKAKADLKEQLAREIKTREIVLEETDSWLKLILLDKILFAKQSDQIKKSSRDFLMKIAKVLNHFEEMEIRITGYTDNQPLSGAAAKKNPTLRHLAVSRAIAIAGFFQKNGQIDPVQIQVAGYGEVRPIVPNDSEYHRTLNGRIEISLHPVQLEQLNKARDIYRAECLMRQKEKTKIQKKKPHDSFESEHETIEPIGEEGLENVDDMDFDAGYEIPEALE